MFFSQAETARRERLTVFRPESAPTVLAGNAHVRVLQPIDMSPEASLQGPPGGAEDLSRDAMGELLLLLKIFYQFPPIVSLRMRNFIFS